MYDELHYFYGILPPLRHTLLGNNGDGQGVLPASSTLYHPSSMSQGRTFKPDYAERHYLARSNVHEPLSARGQCHLNKKNVAEALLFEDKALLPGSLAMERGISALDNARVKAEAAGRQQRGGIAQIGQESLLQPGDLLAWDQGKGKAGGV